MQEARAVSYKLNHDRATKARLLMISQFPKQLGNTVIRTECLETKRGNSVSRFHDLCRTIRHFGISLAVSQAIQNDYITGKLCYFCGQILITIVLEAPLI